MNRKAQKYSYAGVFDSKPLLDLLDKANIQPESVFTPIRRIAVRNIAML
ncbi:MAG: hypothetical protein AAB293_05555 [Pseudomonadota bacterium]